MNRSLRQMLALATLLLSWGPSAVFADEPAESTAEPGAETSAETDRRNKRHFTHETAVTLPAGRWEMGLLKPLRYGVTDDFELSTHPLVNAVMLNIMAKVGITEFRGWNVATEHTLAWPTQLLRTMQGRGYLGGLMLVNGLLPPDAHVPQIITTNHYVMGSAPVGTDHVFTARFGFLLAITFGEGRLPTIDYPVLYTRTAALHDGVAFTGGVDMRGRLYGMLHYRFELDVWGLARSEGNWAVEHALQLSLRTSEQFSIELGYKVVVGDYPFGRDGHILPTFDLHWGWY